MTVWAYARVSARDQNPQLQLDALAAGGGFRLSRRLELEGVPLGPPS